MLENNELSLEFDEKTKLFAANQRIVTSEMSAEEILALNGRWLQEKQQCEAVLAKSDGDMMIMFAERLSQGTAKAIMRYWLMDLVGMGESVEVEMKKFKADVKAQFDEAKKGIKQEKDNRRRRMEELLRVLKAMEEHVKKAQGIVDVRVKKKELELQRTAKANQPVPAVAGKEAPAPEVPAVPEVPIIREDLEKLDVAELKKYPNATGETKEELVAGILSRTTK